MLHASLYIQMECTSRAKGGASRSLCCTKPRVPCTQMQRLARGPAARAGTALPALTRLHGKEVLLHGYHVAMQLCMITRQWEPAGNRGSGRHLEGCRACAHACMRQDDGAHHLPSSPICFKAPPPSPAYGNGLLLSEMWMMLGWQVFQLSFMNPPGSHGHLLAAQHLQQCAALESGATGPCTGGLWSSLFSSSPEPPARVDMLFSSKICKQREEGRANTQSCEDWQEGTGGRRVLSAPRKQNVSSAPILKH